METLYEKLVNAREREALKHGLGDDFAESAINSLSNFEFLCEISEAVEDMFRDREARKG